MPPLPLAPPGGPVPSSSEPPGEALEEGGGCEVSPTSAPLTFRAAAGKRPLSRCQPRGRSVPCSGARPQAATVGLQPGWGEGSQPPSSSLSGPGDPSPTPDPSTSQGLLQAGEVILSTRPAWCEKPATHMQGSRTPKSPAQSLLPQQQPWAPNSLPFIPSWGPSGGPQTPVEGTERGGRSGNGRTGSLTTQRGPRGPLSRGRGAWCTGRPRTLGSRHHPQNTTRAACTVSSATVPAWLDEPFPLL